MSLIPTVKYRLCRGHVTYMILCGILCFVFQFAFLFFHFFPFDLLKEIST